MTADANPSAPGRRGRGLAAFQAVACLPATFIACLWFLMSPDVPAYLRAGFGPEPGILAAGALAALLLWAGFGPALVGLLALRRPQWSLGLPVWALLLAVTFAGLLHLASAGLSWTERPVQFILLLSYVALVLVVGSAVAGSMSLLAWESASKAILFLFVTGLPWIVLAHIMLVSQGMEEGAWTLVRSDPFGGHVFLGLALLMIATNGAALGYALARVRAGAILWSLVARGLLLGRGWVLLRLGLGPEAVQNYLPCPSLGLLLAPVPGADLSAWDLLARWCVAQVGLVFVLALGHSCALRLVAGPAWLQEGEESLPVPPEAEAVAARPARRKPKTRPGRAYLVLGLVYAFLVVYGSLVPLDYHPRPFEEALATFLRTPYLLLQVRNRADLVANLLLFIPLAFLLMGGLSRENRRGGRWLLAALVTAGAAVLAVAIEFAQLFFPPRTVSQNDVLAECAGAAVGAVAWLLVGGRVTAWWRGLTRPRQRGRLAVHLLTGYVVALVLCQLFPYDLVLSADEMIAKIQGGKVILAPFEEVNAAALPALLGALLVYVPVGYLAAVVRSRSPRPVVSALGIGLVFVLGIELLQMLVFSRYTSSTHVVLGTVGAGLGGWLAGRFGPAARRPMPRGGLWWCLSLGLRLACTAAVLGGLVWGKWGPLEFRQPAQGALAALAETVKVPFFYQYWNSEFEAAGQLLRDFLVPVVLGMLFASLAPRFLKGWRLAAGALAGAVGAAAELGQVFFPPHAPDMTTALVAAAGGLIGAFLYKPFVDIFVEPGPAPGSSEDAWGST